MSSSTLIRRASLPAFVLGGLLLATNAHAVILSPAVGDWASAGNPATLASGSSLSISAFETAVQNAFIAGTGGTINFEGTGATGDHTSIESSYGDGVLTITQTGASGGAQINIGANTPAPTSGSGVLGLTTNTLLRTFSFSTPLSTFGLVGLNRDADRTANIEFLLSDNTSVQMSALVNGTSGHTLFNYQAVGGVTIVGFTLSADNFIRWDDFGFVTASAVPEPASAATLVGLAAIGFVALRRRRCKA